jgi:hypothetical protein
VGLDIRWPIGLMFTFIGALLAGFGLARGEDSVTLGLNINLLWGVLLLVFGILMLLGAISGRKSG